MGKPTGVMIIPTGLGCSLGGDAAFNPGVKLIAECCDRLIVNPNAVNASDINELPVNAWYVEGSTIDRFLQGRVYLRPVKDRNRILMVVNAPATPANINSRSAGIWGLGATIDLLELGVPLVMRATMSGDGTASGDYEGVQELIEQVRHREFDALAIQTPIDCDPVVADNYWTNGGVNPWGGVEALVSKVISVALDKPVAHAPVETGWSDLHQRVAVPLQMAPEIISNTYLFCVLKGLHRSPRIDKEWRPGSSSGDDVDFLLTPHGCWGPAHQACLEGQVPIIVVEENRTIYSEDFTYPTKRFVHFVRNYLEAAGFITAMSAGIDPSTVILSE